MHSFAIRLLAPLLLMVAALLGGISIGRFGEVSQMVANIAVSLSISMALLSGLLAPSIFRRAAKPEKPAIQGKGGIGQDLEMPSRQVGP